MSEDLRPAEDALRRGALYGSLGRAFGPVEPYLAEGRAVEELRALLPQWPELEAHASRLPDREAWGPDATEALTAERLRLFEKGECPPYEGAYRREEDPQRDALMADVAGFYRAWGLETEKEMPDHVVSELEFMGLLCLQESRGRLTGDEEAVAVSREAQEKFLADHLGRWIPRFQEALEERARHPLYPVLGTLLAAFIRWDGDHLGVRAPSDPRPEAVP